MEPATEPCSPATIASLINQLLEATRVLFRDPPRQLPRLIAEISQLWKHFAFHVPPKVPILAFGMQTRVESRVSINCLRHLPQSVPMLVRVSPCSWFVRLCGQRRAATCQLTVARARHSGIQFVLLLPRSERSSAVCPSGGVGGRGFRGIILT